VIAVSGEADASQSHEPLSQRELERASGLGIGPRYTGDGSAGLGRPGRVQHVGVQRSGTLIDEPSLPAPPSWSFSLSKLPSVPRDSNAPSLWRLISTPHHAGGKEPGPSWSGSEKTTSARRSPAGYPANQRSVLRRQFRRLGRSPRRPDPGSRRGARCGQSFRARCRRGPSKRPGPSSCVGGPYRDGDRRRAGVPCRTPREIRGRVLCARRRRAPVTPRHRTRRALRWVIKTSSRRHSLFPSRAAGVRLSSGAADERRLSGPLDNGPAIGTAGAE
jgi:hypothetical protein